jgi:hypothetical protein
MNKSSTGFVISIDGIYRDFGNVTLRFDLIMDQTNYSVLHSKQYKNESAINTCYESDLSYAIVLNLMGV